MNLVTPARLAVFGLAALLAIPVAAALPGLGQTLAGPLGIARQTVPPLPAGADQTAFGAIDSATAAADGAVSSLPLPAGPLVDQTIPTPVGTIHVAAADVDSGSLLDASAGIATPPLPVPVGATASAQAHAGLDGASAAAAAHPSVGVSAPAVQASAHADPMAAIASFFSHLFG
jgi:hypothetical protein